jgi:hypothetical protein
MQRAQHGSLCGIMFGSKLDQSLSQLRCIHHQIPTVLIIAHTVLSDRITKFGPLCCT